MWSPWPGTEEPVTGEGGCSRRTPSRGHRYLLSALRGRSGTGWPALSEVPHHTARSCQAQEAAQVKGGRLLDHSRRAA